MCFHNVFTIHSHSHGNKHIWIHNTFVIVAWDIGFHVGQTQLYVFPQPFLIPPINKSTFFTKDETRTHTLIDVVVIPNTCEFISLIFAQFKDLLSNQRKELSQPTLTNQFLLVPIEIFECQHKKIDVFLHASTNAIWELQKVQKLSPFLSWRFFFMKFF